MAGDYVRLTNLEIFSAAVDIAGIVDNILAVKAEFTMMPMLPITSSFVRTGTDTP